MQITIIIITIIDQEESKLWNCGHQKARLLDCIWKNSVVYVGMWQLQVWLLYVEVWNEILTYGATRWDERARTDFAASLNHINDKSAP